MTLYMTRRSLAGILALLVALPQMASSASAAPTMIVHRDPSCGCCEDWVKHIRASGIDATIVNEANMNTVKARLGVPDALVSCHTAEIGGYVIEGHVPARAIQKLLRERPEEIGLSAPGMPIGSPGMESGDARETFEVVLFGKQGVSLYGRYRGGDTA